MGEGCIPVNKIRSWVEATGFNGFYEVEIFSTKYWKQDTIAIFEKNIKHIKSILTNEINS